MLQESVCSTTSLCKTKGKSYKGLMDIICRHYTTVIRRTFTTKRFPSTVRKESGERTGRRENCIAPLTVPTEVQLLVYINPVRKPVKQDNFNNCTCKQI